MEMTLFQEQPVNSASSAKQWLLMLSRLTRLPHRMTADELASTIGSYATMMGDIRSDAFSAETLKAAGRRFKTFPAYAEIAEFFADRRNLDAEPTGYKDDDRFRVTGLAHQAANEWRELNAGKWSEAVEAGYGDLLDDWLVKTFAGMARVKAIDGVFADFGERRRGYRLDVTQNPQPAQLQLDEWRQAGEDRRRHWASVPRPKAKSDWQREHGNG